MTIVTNAERPFERGKCPMCGSEVVYTTYDDPHYKPWRCSGCHGYGNENKTGIGPIHTDLRTAHGTDVVLMQPEDYTLPPVMVQLEDNPKGEPQCSTQISKPEYPRTVLLKSDYSPDTSMRITMTEDGDVVFKIRGSGEMRIATSGGAFHGQQLAKFCEAAKAMMEVAEENNK